jgi:hypothetical protein
VVWLWPGGSLGHRRERIFVVQVDPRATGDRVDLDVRALEEPGHATGEAFAPMHDDRVGAELGLDLGNQVLDGAPVIGANCIALLKRG